MGELVQVNRKYDGKALAALDDNRRQFVLELLARGARPKAALGAAKAAGFTPTYGYALMRDESVLAAIREEATRKVLGSSLLGVTVMEEIALDKDHKDRFKAAKELAALNGFTAEQRIVVEHVNHDTKAQIEQIKTMAGQLGMDPNKLLASVGISNIEDAEFSEVPDGD